MINLLKEVSNMKKALTILGSVVLVMGLTYPVFSRDSGQVGDHHMSGDHGGSGMNWQDGRMYSNLSPEQQAQMDRLHRKFTDETASIRTQIRKRSMELNRILNTSDPNFGKARALQTEISELRTKLDQEQLNYELESRKIAPTADHGRGYGSHHMGGNQSDMGYGHMGGYGSDRGYGRHMGGYGSGGCN
jgi:Spy/CpxP family protein refolding chaperone